MGAFKRFLGLFGPKLIEADLELVDAYLDQPGQFLFFQMSRVDQRHSIAVAREVIAEVGYKRGVDLKTLVQAALLHDVGKVEGDLNPVNRVAAGLIRRMIPSWRDKYCTSSRMGWWKIGYGFYVDKIHPLRGSHMAKILGVEAAVVDLIRHHHDPPREGQTPELTFLQLADNKH